MDARIRLSDTLSTWLPDDLQYLTLGALMSGLLAVLTLDDQLYLYYRWLAVLDFRMTCCTWLHDALTSGLPSVLDFWMNSCSLFPDDLPYLTTGWHAVLDFLKTGCTWLQDALTSGWHAVFYFCKTCCTWLLDDLPYWSSRWLAVIDFRVP